MGISVTALRNKLKQGGARPSLFYCKLNFPNQAAVGQTQSLETIIESTIKMKDISFFVKSGQIPESTIANVPINFLGREFKVPSIDRTFADWTVTVINDEDYRIRHAFETWIEFMAPGKAIFESKAGFGENSPVFADLEVHQLKKGGNVSVTGEGEGVTAGQFLGSYYFKDAFPTNVSAIDLSWDTKDTIEEFSVTFSYQYWEKKPSETPAANPFVANDSAGIPEAFGWSGATTS